jgi:hypothetical protein
MISSIAYYKIKGRFAARNIRSGMSKCYMKCNDLNSFNQSILTERAGLASLGIYNLDL